MNIPPKFWKSLTDEEFAGICETSMLTRRLCRRLWSMQGLTERPPHRLLVVLSAEDVRRLFPAKGDMQ